MKKLFNTFTLVYLFFPLLCFAQEPMVFHFNFSFEKSHWESVTEWTLTDDIENMAVKIYSSEGSPVWERGFVKNNLTKDKYGYCLLSDTMKTIKKSREPYVLKADYQLTSGIKDSCELSFYYPDTLSRLALELYFDQVVITKSTIDTVHDLVDEDHGIDPYPKPVLVVKYLEPDTGVFLEPTWFNIYSTPRRPEYILRNNSTNEIFRYNDRPLTSFFGDLYILESGTWQSYRAWGFCGTYNPKEKIEPYEKFDIVEGYYIAEPRKLKSGYYQYRVRYKDINGEEKTANTDFSVIYTNKW